MSIRYSDELHVAQVIAPHATRRGTYDRGTPCQRLVYSSNGKMLAPPPDSTPATGDQYGGVARGGTYEGTATHCVEVDWPSAYTWSARQYRRGYNGPSAWMGSLIFESRDASGLYYRRNRYYDFEKGRFTQEDPIGMAGGINLYGFGYGDPITLGDPFGLCPPCRMSAAGLERIRVHEDMRSRVYPDQAGYPTIGYGHKLTAGESFPNGISQAEANELFARDVGEKVNPSLDRITAGLNQNQVDAIGSFIYNAGSGTFARYVLPALNRGDFAEATAQMASIRMAGGKVSQGLVLVNRRTAEIKLFNTPVVTNVCNGHQCLYARRRKGMRIRVAILTGLWTIGLGACNKGDGSLRETGRVTQVPDSAPTDTACSEAETTVEIRTCESASLRSSDAHLVALEDRLRMALDTTSGRLLADSRTQWLLYRQRECGVFDSVYAGGTMAPIAVLGCLRDLTDARIMFLSRAYSAQLANSPL